MSHATNIHLGFEIPSGRPVSIPLRHLAVTGQTQESGKTTTLEALISRTNLPAIAFVTKRGEGGFSTGRRITPYFRDRADWQFVTSIIDATLAEKNKFLRPWIMRICRTTRTLADVQREVRKALTKAKGINEGVYTQLDAYLDLIVPDVAKIPFSIALDIQPGLNVMDVTAYSTPMQMLFVQSAIDWVNAHAAGTITIIPEAWEFVPEGKSSPVKASAISLVRKGAGLGNYIWVDSQDMAGVDKTILRGCAVWLIGVQREANEIKRNLSNIPAGIQQPKARDIAMLDRGQFYACWKDRTVKVYVQPYWMSGTDGQAIATGRMSIDDAERPKPQEQPMSANVEQKLDKLLEFMMRGQSTQQAMDQMTNPPAATQPSSTDEESLYQRFKTRLMRESPTILRVLAERPELEIAVERQVVQIDGTSLRGRLAKMIHEGWFDEPKTGAAAVTELVRRGFSTARPNVYKELDKFAEMGFLTKETDGYQAAKDMKINLVKK